MRSDDRYVRITHSEGQHLICLSDAEASSVVEACALLVLAVKSDDRVSLPPEMNKVLCDLFDGLRSFTPAAATAEGG